MKRALFLAAGALALAAEARVLESPVVVTQWQYYPVREQARGYLGRYPDQPLVVDSDLPEDADKTGIADPPCWCMYNSMADIDAMYAEGKSYGLDGFAFFPCGGGRAPLWRARESKVAGMLTQPIVNFWKSEKLEAGIEQIANAVKFGCGAKVNGKALVLSYWCDRNNTPAELAEKLCQAREKLGDTFAFMASVGWSDGLWDYRAAGEIAPKRVEEMKERFRSYLRVADGILLDGTMTNHAVTNSTRVYASAYHKIVAKLARGVADEPEFKGRKLLGFTLSIGHQNAYHQSYTANAIGTEALRGSFEAAIAGDPDVILIPEWDECNESTSWKPTLYNGYTTKRLYRYYDAVLRKRQQTPMEGDDVRVPNVMLSYRRLCSPGEWLYFEAVSVPDGARKGEVRLAVELADADGKTLLRTPERKLSETKLDATRWDVHSDELAEKTRALQVRLVVNGKPTDGFCPIDLAPANSWCLKDVKQALRDLAPVRTHTFERHGRKISAALACDEPMRSVMLVGNGWIQYIHNPASACSRFREDDDFAVFTIGATRTRDVRHPFFYSLPGHPEAEWLCRNRVEKGERFGVGWLSQNSENVYVRLPKSALNGAVLKIDYAGIFQGEVRLDDAYRLGVFSVGAPEGLACAVARFRLQSRYPSALNEKSCAFEIAPDADRRSMAYFLQVVTMSGKTWRSEPIVVEKSETTKPVRVWSALKAKPVDLLLPEGRVPSLDYDFSPTAGNVLRTRSGERHFFGMAGGAAALATLWNRGSELDCAMRRPHPCWLSDTYPKREQDDAGRWALVFDGKSSFATFPQETVPQWAASAITLEFNQAPEGAMRKELLFGSRSGNRMGVCDILLDRGEVLVCTELSDDRISGKPFEFSTGLKATPGTWHTLLVRATGTALEVTLDGRVVSKPMGLPGVFMNPALLAGSTRPDAQFYTGKVRLLTIDHATR